MLRKNPARYEQELRRPTGSGTRDCALLSAVALPQPCRSIGHRAFAECNSPVCLTYRSAQAGQHDIHVAANAFEGCLAPAVPGGICVLSTWGIDKGL